MKRWVEGKKCATMKRALCCLLSLALIVVNGTAILLPLDSEKGSFDYSWAAFSSLLLGLALLSMGAMKSDNL
jgi:hypothetical protein